MLVASTYHVRGGHVMVHVFHMFHMFHMMVHMMIVMIMMVHMMIVALFPAPKQGLVPGPPRVVDRFEIDLTSGECTIK